MSETELNTLYAAQYKKLINTTITAILSLLSTGVITVSIVFLTMWSNDKIQDKRISDLEATNKSICISQAELARAVNLKPDRADLESIKVDNQEGISEIKKDIRIITSYIMTTK